MFTAKNSETKQLSFDNYESQLTKEHDYLNKYLDLNSTRIEITIQELEELLQNELEQNPDDETLIHEFYDKKLKSILSFYYHSSITLVHSFFENQLLILCNIIKTDTRNKLDISKLRGSDLIKRSLYYLSLTANVDKLLLDRHKPRLGKFQKLRNKIIHDNSTYKDDEIKNNLINDFGDNIEFYEIEQKFFLNSDALPKEYLENSFAFMIELLDYLKRTDFLIISEGINIEDDDLPF